MSSTDDGYYTKRSGDGHNGVSRFHGVFREVPHSNRFETEYLFLPFIFAGLSKRPPLCEDHRLHERLPQLLPVRPRGPVRVQPEQQNMPAGERRLKAGVARSWRRQVPQAMIPALNMLLARRATNETLRRAGGDPDDRTLRDGVVAWTKEIEAHLRKAGKYGRTSSPTSVVTHCSKSWKAIYATNFVLYRKMKNNSSKMKKYDSYNYFRT